MAGSFYRIQIAEQDRIAAIFYNLREGIFQGAQNLVNLFVTKLVF